MNSGIYAPNTGGKGDGMVAKSWAFKTPSNIVVTYPDAGGRAVAGFSYRVYLPWDSEYYVQYSAVMFKVGGVNNALQLDGVDIPSVRMNEDFGGWNGGSAMMGSIVTIKPGWHTFSVMDQANVNLNNLTINAGASIVIFKLPLVY